MDNHRLTLRMSLKARANACSDPSRAAPIVVLLALALPATFAQAASTGFSNQVLSDGPIA